MTQNSHCMEEIFLKIRYFERGLLKNLKLLTFFFLSNPVPFNGQNHQKQKGPGTNDQSLRFRNKFREIPLLGMYYPYSKNHICTFMQANS